MVFELLTARGKIFVKWDYYQYFSTVLDNGFVPNR